MNTSTYQAIKKFIYNRLLEFSDTLPGNQIGKEIEDFRVHFFNKIDANLLAKMLMVPAIEPLSSKDWERMQRELETHFNVEMENGTLIQGEEQQKRDNSWWTSVEKLRNENYYWNRYKEMLRKDLPPEVVKAIDEDTDVAMNNIENPTIEEFSRYGMVVGHVQSGKTGNYAALVCKAADAGYKFIVVIAGGMNNLRNQTQKRMNAAFVGVMDDGTRVGVGKLGIHRERLPISLTTAEQDFNRRDANKISQGLNFDNISSPVLLVIKKNASTLRNVISWLESQYKDQISKHAMLIIDDESDYASINTKDEEDPTIINKRIRKLIQFFRKSAYVAFTATPYANIFIDHKAETEEHGSDLFPRDFIYALQAPSNYFGARKIFIESNGKYLIKIKDHQKTLPLNHKITHEYDLNRLPDSLYDAIRLFIINVAIRNLRGQGNKHNSMLVHVTRFTAVHKKVSFLIEEYFTDVKKHINAFSRLRNAEIQSHHISEIKNTLANTHKNIEYDWSIILRAISQTINSIVIREVHTETKIPLEYRDNEVTNAIVIGGTSLSRGFTLEGLSVSYFLRNSMFYDTLMQMGRWFGYRSDYEDICRIYMTSEMIDKFRLIIEATEDLYDDFKRMSLNKMTPRDFGLAVKHHPDSGLQVTARNKLKNSKDLYFEMKLDGHLKETAWIVNDEEINANNLKVIKKTIETIDSLTEVEREQVNNNYIWKYVSKEFVEEFLNNFHVYGADDEFGLQSRMPLKFVKKYVEEVETKWDIALYGGHSELTEDIVGDQTKLKLAKRTVEDKGKYYEVLHRQVSSGAAEAIAFSEQERRSLGSNRKDIRQLMKRPLLMLHILDAQIQATNERKVLAAFGISFPGGIKTEKKLIKLKINSVYVEQLLNEEKYDDY